MNMDTLLKHVGSLLLLIALMVLAVGSTDSGSSSKSEPGVPQPSAPPVPGIAQSTPSKSSAEEARASLEKARTAAMQKLEAGADYQKAKEDLKSAKERIVAASNKDGNSDLGAAMRDYAAASNTISVMTKEAANSADVKAAEQKLADALARTPGTPNHLEHEVRKALGESNRNVTRVFKVEIAGRAIHVYFSLQDNFTEGFIKTGAKMDVRNILKAIQGSGYAYSTVTAIGTFSMADKFGNSSEGTVLAASYKRSTVDRINWNSFLTDNIYSIADSVWLDPAFQ